MSRERKIPTGRIARLARLAASGAKTGTGLLLTRGRADALAEDAAEVLGTLRGLAAKVGQMASYVDGMVPEEVRPAFEKGMAALRAAAPTSSPSEIQALVEEELGASVSTLFAEWEREPFASASIGQVHRARLHDGREVAVKVQHPGIERAVKSDLDNASSVESMVRVFGAGKLGSKQALAEIRERFEQELDYRHEAEQQRWFREFHAGDPSVVVPEVIEDRSARRVITSEMVSGASLEDVTERDEEARRAYAETLWRFVFRGNMVGGRFNADPHPGNYLFQDGGRIAFLDFGCVQPIAKEHQANAIAAHRAAIDRDEAVFFDAVKKLLGTRGGKYEEIALGYTRRLFAPLFESPYRITRDYVTGVVMEVQSMKKAVLGRDARFVPMPPGMLFMNRLQFGFYSVLARLDVEVDYAAIERGFLPRAAGTPK